MTDQTPKLTPMMERYMEVKRENPGSLLLFRMGDFYELFYEDARKAARLLDITLTRRGQSSSGGPAPTTTLRYADLTMDLLGRRVDRCGKRIDLQPREFRLLEVLLRHPEQVLTRTMLLEKVWDYRFDPQTNIIDVHISRLRQKIDRDFEPALIQTVRGAGYALRVPDQVA